MNDQDTTRQLPPAEPPREPPTEPRRLLRSRGDRVIAGVCAGLGKYFGVDPVIVRIAFAVSIFFGGLGVIAYAALALFVPSAGAVSAVLRKLQLSNRHELSRWAVGRRLVD